MRLRPRPCKPSPPRTNDDALMPPTVHANKTLAVYDEHGIPRSEFKRVCLRCRRPIHGYGFHTFYGIFVRPDGRRIPACGEPLHERCPNANTPRKVPHDPAELGASKVITMSRHIEVGITLLHHGRFAARVDKKRLGTHETLEKARAARVAYLKQRSRSNRDGNTRQRKKRK